MDVDGGETEGLEWHYLEHLKKRREWFDKIRFEGRSMMQIARENPNRDPHEHRFICYIVSGKLLKIAKALMRRSGKCSRCRQEVDLPFVTPCAHLLCDGCLVRDRTACVVQGCRNPYEMGRNEEPKDLIEMKPSTFSGD